MDDAELKLLTSLDDIEADLWDRVRRILSEFKTEKGYLVPDQANTRLINSLKRELRQVIKSSTFPDEVDEFLTSFDGIGDNMRAIHKELNGINVPKDLVNKQKQLAIQNTVTSLVDSNVSLSFVEPIKRSLVNHINFGSGVLDAERELRQYIMGQSGNSGVLHRWVGQVARDSVQQYEGAINQKIAEKYNLTAWRYVGPSGGVTRPQCNRWMSKGTLTREELAAEIAWAESNGSGMIPGTTPDNWAVRRGGYNCRHTAYPVKEDSKEIKPKKKPAPKKKPPKKTKFDEARAQSMIPDGWKRSTSRQLPLEFWSLFQEKTPFKINSRKSSHFAEYSSKSHKEHNFVSINRKRHAGNVQHVMAHEYGHVLHQQLNIFNKSSYGDGRGWPEWTDTWSKARVAAGAEANTAEEILGNLDVLEKLDKIFTKRDVDIDGFKLREYPERVRVAKKLGLELYSNYEGELWGAFADTIEALTDARHGFGHGAAYYQKSRWGNPKFFNHAEFFAHIMESKYSEPNPYTKELMPDLFKIMMDFADVLVQKRSL